MESKTFKGGAQVVAGFIRQQAMDFERAAQRCLDSGEVGEKYPKQSLMGPYVVLLAFAAELNLKAILAEQGADTHDHDLVKLFSRLSPQAQTAIVEKVDLPDFLDLLSASALTFVTMRYSYEHLRSSAYPGFLERLSHAAASLLVLKGFHFPD